MSVYKLHKRGRTGRRVAVRAERIEWNVPAMIICFLLACAIWLYTVSFSNASHEEDGAGDATPTVASLTDAESHTAGDAP